MTISRDNGLNQWFLRPAILWAFRSVPALNKRMRIADQGLMATLAKTGAS
jgi:hypothetical protein